MAKLQVIGWTPSRLAKYNECPAKVKYEDLLHMCPVCFKGQISGGFNREPVQCDTCSKPQPTRAPLERGDRLDESLTRYVAHGLVSPHKQASDEEAEPYEETFREATRHKKILALVKRLQKTAGVRVQASFVFDKDWNSISQYTKGAWARLKLDVLQIFKDKAWVWDWKSGNIDKRKMEIREKPDYANAMNAYQMAVLAAHPEVQTVEAAMVFLDAPPKLDEPFRHMRTLTRKDLPKAQKEWEKKIKPMMSDRVFAPRPGYYCGYCPFAKGKGGPCKF